MPFLARITGAFAALLWLAVNGALLAFYAGDIGIGSGGDSGMLSAVLNELLVYIGILILWLVLALIVLPAECHQPRRILVMIADLLLLGLSYWAATDAAGLVTPALTEAIPVLDPAQAGIRTPPPWPHPPYTWPFLATGLTPPLWGAVAILAKQPATVGWTLRGAILVVSGLVLAR